MELKEEINKIKNKKEDEEALIPTLSATSVTDDIYIDISSLIEKSKNIAYQSVNVILIQRNWLIGKRIHNEELKDSRMKIMV